MNYEVCLHLPNLSMRILWSGSDWIKCKEEFNFWANEYRDSMDSIRIRVRR